MKAAEMTANPKESPTSVPFGENFQDATKAMTKSEVHTVLAILSPHMTIKKAPKIAPPRYPIEINVIVNII